ncbi:hypothetical protein ACO0QE_004258 [Hanseniaspora vineae]
MNDTNAKLPRGNTLGVENAAAKLGTDFASVENVAANLNTNSVAAENVAAGNVAAENVAATSSTHTTPAQNSAAQSSASSVPALDLKRFEKIGKRITVEIENIQLRCVGELETLKMENLNVKKENLLLSYKLNKAQYELDNLRNSKSDLMEYVKLSNQQMLQLYSDVLDLHNCAKKEEMVIQIINDGTGGEKAKKKLLRMYEQQQARLNILLSKINYMKNFDYTPFANHAVVGDSELETNSSAFVSGERSEGSDLQLLLQDAEASLLKVKQDIADSNKSVETPATRDDQNKAISLPENGSTAHNKDSSGPTDRAGSNLSFVYDSAEDKRENAHAGKQLAHSNKNVDDQTSSKEQQNPASLPMQENVLPYTNGINAFQKETVGLAGFLNSTGQASPKQQTKSASEASIKNQNTLADSKNFPENKPVQMVSTSINSLLNPVSSAPSVKQQAQQIPRGTATLQTSLSNIANTSLDNVEGAKHRGEHDTEITPAAFSSKKLRLSLDSQPISSSDEISQMFSET